MALSNLNLRTGLESRGTIAVLAHSAGITDGAERSHVEMVHELIDLGYQVHTLAADTEDKGMGEAIRAEGGTLRVIPGISRWWRRQGDPALQTPFPYSPPSILLEELVAINPDLLITQTITIPQGALAARMLGIPHVWYLREFGDLDHGFVMPLPAKQLGELVRTLSTEVVTNSAAVRDHFFGKSIENVTVLHPTPKLKTSAIAKAGKKPWSLGVVARLESRGKRQFDALSAIAALRANGLDVPIQLFGYLDDSIADIWQGHAKNLGIEDLVTFAGVTTSREDMFASFDAIAVTSQNEAFGRIPFEATSAGVPVIYADAAGPSEYLTDGVTGLAYQPLDHFGLAAAIKKLHDDATLGRELVARARQDLLSEERALEYRQILAEIVERTINAGPKPKLIAAFRDIYTLSGGRDFLVPDYIEPPEVQGLKKHVKSLQRQISDANAEMTRQRRLLEKAGVNHL